MGGHTQSQLVWRIAALPALTQRLCACQILIKLDERKQRLRLKTVRARMEQIEVNRALAQQQLSDLTLVSPAGGVVEYEAAEPGQKVRPGQELALIQTANFPQGITYVREQEVNRLAVGSVASVHSPGVPGHSYEVRIESVAIATDPPTGNFSVKLQLENRHGLLREGRSPSVELVAALGEQRLLLPRNAITDRDRQQVMFIARGGRAAGHAGTGLRHR